METGNNRCNNYSNYFHIFNYFLCTCKENEYCENCAILVGVDHICGGSAIAATAPVIEADDEDVAQAISVIFFFNVIAALIFPLLGSMIGFFHSFWRSFRNICRNCCKWYIISNSGSRNLIGLYNLGTQTLDKAVTVKLTRTLALFQSLWYCRIWEN